MLHDNPEARQQVHIRLGERMAAKLRAICVVEDRSLSGLIRTLLSDALERRESERL
jgi:hypothetical protein